MPKRNYTLPLLIVILLIAAAVRFFHIESQSIWFDEGWSAYAAVQPNLQAAIDSDKTNPPLYYGIVNIAAHGFGDSEFSLRWVSLAFGLIASTLAYQLGKQLFNPQAGVMAALLMAFSPLLWWASQEARMYSLLAVLVLLCAMAWHKLIPNPSSAKCWRWWLVLWLSELALLYAHNTGPVVVLWLNVITILALSIHFIRTRRSTLLSTRHSVLSTIFLWLGGQIAVGLLWSPYFVNRFLRLSAANSAVTSTSPLSLDELSRLWQAVWTGTWAMVGHEPLLVTLSGLAFILALVLIPWRKANARWLVLHVVILTAGLWLALSILGNEVHGRYLVMIVPLLLVAIAAGFSSLSTSSLSTQHSVLSTFSLGTRYLALGTFILTFALAVHFATTNGAYQHDDARGMARYYADHLTANDSALMWSYADRYELAYYWDRLGVKAKRITLPEGADLDTVLPLLPTSGDVALNIWYTQRADYRGMMGCLVSDGTVNEPERFDAYGMTNLLFHAPTLHPTTLKPIESSLSMAEISAVGEITPAPADRAICVPIQITLTQPTTVDLKAAVSIQNSFGTEIARTDAIFADRVQRLSSQLPVGSVLTAYALLRLPYGAPAGDYSLQIRVYDEQAQPSGYNLVYDGQNHPDLSIDFSRTSGSNWAAVNREPGGYLKQNKAVSADLTLVGTEDYVGGTVHPGEDFQITSLWKGKGDIPAFKLVDSEHGWSVDLPAPLYENRDDVILDWRPMHIPDDAQSGIITLELPDSKEIGYFVVEAIPFLKTPPPMDVATNVTIPNIGTLVGYSVTDMSNRSQPFTLTLVWQAEQPTTTNYTVFAQLVSSDGQVIAQDDMMPAKGTRPTTGWRAGEYIVDEHLIAFHNDAQPTTARLIVGLYNAATSQRVPITPTSDFITLQTDIRVR
jgi:uncharacterized membrane protein